MKIIPSSVPATSAATPTSPAQEIKLSLIPAANPPSVSEEELRKLKDQLQAVQEELNHWRQEYKQEFDQRMAQVKQEWQTQMGNLAENSKKSFARLEERLATQTPPAALAPTPQDTWDSDLKRKEKNLQDLKAELTKLSVAAPVIPKMESQPQETEPPAAAIPTPPGKLDVDGLKKQLAQESTYGTSSRTSSIFAKLWLYLNEPAIEIPVKNSKNS